MSDTAAVTPETVLPPRLAVRCVVDPETGCWEWVGARNEHGYGMIFVEKRPNGSSRMARVHRIAFEHAVRPLGPGEEACHHCDNPPCMRPDHLFGGTHRENLLDMSAKGRQVFQKHPERAPKGERNGRVKLTNEQVVELRRRREAGASTRELTAAFGIGATQVHRIVRRRQRVEC